MARPAEGAGGGGGGGGCGAEDFVFDPSFSQLPLLSEDAHFGTSILVCFRRVWGG